ncbi:hypothetical protein [Klebsiella quasipneumoniae]|uniref:hypothetical protein n=1 Tax=Klebsiella quasipneumoniae TaxID=1463165 RepID=UPI0011251A10|nr:hypothetical protein [Klebsiella quasipneumoniae]
MATNVITTIRRSRGVAFFLDSSSGFVNIIFSLLALSVLPIPTPAEVSSRQYCRDERLASCYLIPRVKVTIPVITIQRPVQAFLANTTLKISFLWLKLTMPAADSTLIIFSHVTDKKYLLLSMIRGWKRQTPDDVIE